VGLHGKYFFPMKHSKVSPCLLVGAGFHSVKGKVTFMGVSNDSTESRPGFKVGLGAGWKASPMVTIGLEANYNYVATGKNKALTQDISSINWMDVRAAVTFSPSYSKKK
jgi:opacity protein-like surface antigen